MKKEEIEAIKVDEATREDFLRSYEKKIRFWASKASKRFVSEHDDLYSIALIAFNDAIDSYEAEKGAFISFSKKAVQNRIIDHLRKESREKALPFSSFEKEEESESELQIASAESFSTPLAIEIFSLSEELKKFRIDFYTLAKSSPAAKKTRSACRALAKEIAEDPTLLEKMYEKRTLPASLICKKTGAKPKLLEKFRKYIITGALIYANSYVCLCEYFNGGDTKR